MGVYLSTPKTEKTSEDGENSKLKFGYSSMQGWRSTMEDAHAAELDLDDQTSFFGVYDGHGGKAVAKFCAKYLHVETMRNYAASGDMAESLRKSFFRMDEMMQGQRGWREIAQLGDKVQKISGMIENWIYSPKGGESANNHIDDWAFEEGPHSDYTGPTEGSTACVAVVKNKQIIVSNAGDSRCVLSRNRQAVDLSKDHKPDLAIERERIIEAGGFVHVGRVNGTLSLARAIGDMEFKQNKFLPAEKQIVTCNPDINIIELTDEDEFMVLACDGIWDVLSSQQVVDFIHEHLNNENKLSAVCEKVLDRCLAPPSSVHGEGCDNMTMVLVQFKKP